MLTKTRLKHEHYPIPTVEEIVSKIPDARMFMLFLPATGTSNETSL